MRSVSRLMTLPLSGVLAESGDLELRRGDARPDESLYGIYYRPLSWEC